MWTGTKDEAPVNLRLTGGPGAKGVINLEEGLVRKYRHVTLVALQVFFFFFSSTDQRLFQEFHSGWMEKSFLH